MQVDKILELYPSISYRQLNLWSKNIPLPTPSREGKTHRNFPDSALPMLEELTRLQSEGKKSYDELSWRLFLQGYPIPVERIQSICTTAYQDLISSSISLVDFNKPTRSFSWLILKMINSQSETMIQELDDFVSDESGEVSYDRTNPLESNFIASEELTVRDITQPLFKEITSLLEGKAVTILFPYWKPLLKPLLLPLFKSKLSFFTKGMIKSLSEINLQTEIKSLSEENLLKVQQFLLESNESVFLPLKVLIGEYIPNNLANGTGFLSPISSLIIPLIIGLQTSPNFRIILETLESNIQSTKQDIFFKLNPIALFSRISSDVHTTSVENDPLMLGWKLLAQVISGEL